MNEIETEVYYLFRNWRRIQAEKEMMTVAEEVLSEYNEEHEDGYSIVLKKLQSWMLLLDEDERFVIKRHLVDGLSWKRVVYEYNTKLLRATKKSYSTIRRMQSQGIARIVGYMEENNEDLQSIIGLSFFALPIKIHP